MRRTPSWLKDFIDHARIGTEPDAPAPAAASAASCARTAVVERIWAGARWALQAGGIVLATGPAGIGKTMAGQAMCAETPGAMFVSVRTMGQTAKGVMEQICEVGNVMMIGTKSRMFGNLVAALKDSGRLLVVDEIHKLEGRRNDEALHALRDLHDATGIPMVWTGMPNIANYIQTGRAKGYEPLDQLYSRIGLWLDLREAVQGGGDDGGATLATLEDVRRFIATRKLRLTTDGERYLLALINTPGSGAYRTADKLLALAAKLAGDEPITAEVLRGIQAMRLGTQGAATLETRIAYETAKAVSA